MDIPKYIIEITPRALNHIYSLIAKIMSLEDAAIVISDKRVIGSGYEILIYPLNRIKDSLNYVCLFSKEHNNYGFPIYIDMQLITEHTLPRRFGLDLFTNSKGQIIIDVKNPQFEQY